MKYLKIENNKAYYYDGSDHKEIDKINKDGLLAILEAAGDDEFEMDSYDENILGNKAHQIIYENIHNKLMQFLADKDQFKNEVEELFKKAIDEYSAETDNEDEMIPDNNTDDSEINIDEIPF